MGSHLIQEAFSHALEQNNTISEQTLESVSTDVIELLKQQLKPEFLNRIDEIVTFEPLTQSDIEQIVDMQMHNLSQLLAHNGITLQYTEQVRKRVATIGYDAMYGARPVKRTIQREIVGELSKRILAGDVDRTRPIRISIENDLLHFSN
jgi:ATP-dependent Clp protease ATP-binding subunit ClpB